MEEEVSMAIPQGSVQPPTICVVPEDLAEGNKGAYTPKVICIGPLFDGERTMASMLMLEHYKRCCVRKLVVGGESEAWSPDIHGPLLRNCFDTIMRLLPQIRASYSSMSSSSKQGEGAMSDDEQLAMTMMLDGCFVLYRLLKHARMAKSGGAMESDYDEWTHLFGRCWVWGTVKRELLLVSNQVPFFVVWKLFKHLKVKGNATSERDDTLLISDDVVVFLKSEASEVRAIRVILDCFGKVSGLCVNLSKSVVAPIRCEPYVVNEIVPALDCPVLEVPCSNLGMPLSVRRLRKGDLQLVLDKLANELTL
ncbi:hypothetical protein ACQ4PT_055681 [Festuca glaucescens]